MTETAQTIWRNVVALLIVIVPINAWMIWYRLAQEENFSTTDMTVYPLVIGGGMVVLTLLLNKYLLKSTFKETFNSGRGKLGSDLLWGLGLTAVYFALFFLERVTIYQWIPRNSPPSTELIDTMVDLANSPMLMVLWFGPVLWVGIAFFEEVSRVFFLKCLWNMDANRNWQMLSILTVSAVIGFAHLYQGTAGIISIGVKSVVACLFFYKYRRFWPLVVSHGLYDGFQFLFFVIQFRH